MYVIVVYDMNSQRTSVLRKFLRSKLNHVQNSVFEGSLTEARAEELVEGVEERINTDESAIVYLMQDEKFVDRRELGETTDNSRVL